MPKPFLTPAWIPPLVVAVFVGGCDRGPELPARGAPDAVYTVRAKVLTVPDPAQPTSEFLAHHEPIPDFVNPNGTKGMEAMAMPFPLGRGVRLDGIAAGDVVEITFSLWTTPGQRGFEATRVVELPPETRLNLGNPAP